MMRISVILLSLLAILSICNAQIKDVRPEREFYRAAVHELKQYDDDTSSGRDIISKNLERCALAGELAAKNDVDIIIFPEKALFPMKIKNMTWLLNYAEDVPDGSAGAIPCDEEKYSDNPILKTFSCMAQKHNYFVVANLIDVKKCQVKKKCSNKITKNYCVIKRSDCPDSGYFKFNTLVAFNRSGVLISRYYKRHPFFITDGGITVPKHPQPAYFNTDFGLFSSDVGFDFFFNDPIIDIQKRPETNAIAYTNWWFDHTPLAYFGVPNQQAFCLANNVTVLSSDVHSPHFASIGSGIYLPGRGAVVYSYNPDGKSKLLISNVPTSKSVTSYSDKSLNTKFFYIEDDGTVNELNGEEPRNFKEECGENVLGMAPSSLTDYRCKQSKVDQYTFVKLNKTEDHINVCSNNFCCSLEYQADSMDETFYFAVSGNKLNFYNKYLVGVESCILARCEPVDGKPCRNFLLKSNTKFRSLNITGSFDTKYIFPHVLDNELRLTDRDEWQFDGKSLLSYTNMNGKYLLYADLYGRKYEEDGLVQN